MMTYRLYLVGSDGHFADAVVLEYPNDDAAVEAAALYPDTRPKELWNLDRKVKSFSATDKRAGSRPSMV